jgi:hypothetical protein
MAERRMFAMTIIDSDSFLDMPLSTQALYFHLSMRADDDGFINNPKKIQRIIGCTDDDFKLLITKRFIITFESGVIVIKHWKIHNYIQKDRYKPTLYQKEKKLLAEKENGSYTDCTAGGYSLDTVCIQDVYSLDTQVSIGKNSKELEIEKEECNTSDKPKRTRFVPPTLEEVQAYCKERNNTVDAEHFINYYTSNGWRVGRNKMKDYKAAIRTWEKNGYSKPKEEPKEDTSKWAGTVY